MAPAYMTEIANIIAIDGPAGSGKSTLAEQLAAKFGYLYFDTGVMYRAVTLAALRRDISMSDRAAIAGLAEQLDIDVRPPSKPDGRQYDVRLDGADVTWGIRSHEVDANVSVVSMIPRVRKAMTRKQREIGLRGRVVMVGRDIGTVVLPEAQLKVYLDASVEARARRRFEEARRQRQPVDFEEILNSMKERDRMDSTRELAPLRVAPDAVVIDSTVMTIEQVVSQVERLAQRRQ
jgi:cytidylate kinase